MESFRADKLRRIALDAITLAQLGTSTKEQFAEHTKTKPGSAQHRLKQLEDAGLATRSGKRGGYVFASTSPVRGVTRQEAHELVDVIFGGR